MHYQSNISSPLGNFAAIASDEALLSFVFSNKQEHNPNQLLLALQEQVNAYFAGNLKDFDIPILPFGSLFCMNVCQELTKVVYGTTASYKDIALKLNTHQRAIAKAVSTNKIALIIPCHRIIMSSGKLGGFAWGVDKKEFLIKLEKQNH